MLRRPLAVPSATAAHHDGRSAGVPGGRASVREAAPGHAAPVATLVVAATRGRAAAGGLGARTAPSSSRGRNRVRLAVALAATVAPSSACSSTPPFAGWTAEQLYAHGEEAFAEEDWGDAREAFEHILLSYPGFAGVVDARYYLARAFFEDEEYVSAVSEFTRIVQAYPDHERADDAWMGLCRSYAALSPHPQRDQQYTQQARTTCENVATDFRGTATGDSAAVVAGRMQDKLAARAFGEAQFYFQRDIYQSAELGFLQLLDEFPNTVSAPLALVRLIEIYEKWGWDEERDEHEDRLLEEYPDSPEARTVAAKVRPDSTAGSAAAPGAAARAWGLEQGGMGRDPAERGLRCA